MESIVEFWPFFLDIINHLFMSLFDDLRTNRVTAVLFHTFQVKSFFYILFDIWLIEYFFESCLCDLGFLLRTSFRSSEICMFERGERRPGLLFLGGVLYRFSFGFLILDIMPLDTCIPSCAKLLIIKENE